MPLKAVDGSFTWTEFIEQAIYHAKDLFAKEMSDLCIGSNESAGVKIGLHSNKGTTYTIDVFKVEKSYWRRLLRGGKTTVSRNILRVIDILGPNRFITVEDNYSVGRTVRELPGCFFPPVTGKEPLKK